MIGAIFCGAGCAALGWLYAGHSMWRVHFWEELYQTLQTLCNQIDYALLPLPQCLSQAESKPLCGAIFAGMLRNLTGNTPQEAYVCAVEACLKTPQYQRLTQQDEQLLLGAASIFAPLRSQIVESAHAYCGQVLQYINFIRPQCQKGAKLCGTLGMFGGALLFILLV